MAIKAKITAKKPDTERTTPPQFEYVNEFDEVHIYTYLTTYIAYAILILVGNVRDYFGKKFKKQDYAHLRHQNGYAPLVSDFESLYTRRIYYRVRDCFNRPVTGVPGGHIKVLERETTDYNRTFKLTGKSKDLLNLSSYNYLGFAQSEGWCADRVAETVSELGITSGAPRALGGSFQLHKEAEDLVARFMGVESSLIVSMGYATNSTTIPALVSKGCLILSDELNHASLVNGSRLSGATIRVFRHNDINDLENLLRECISQGQPRTHRPWKKILVIVEGLYSMEGDFCNLPGIVALKDKYKFYLFMDEAHSIGAMGPRGRGMCDYWGVNPNDVDILMGTFTKSFGAAGGYISGKKDLIDYLKSRCHSHIYAESVSVPVLAQIISSMKVIMGEDGTDLGARKLRQLKENSRFFASKLKELGFLIVGNNDSPVIPLILFQPSKIAYFSRACMERGIAVVVVGYPATPITLCRARFCISASHTIEDLDMAVKHISELGDEMQSKIRKSLF